MKFTNKIWCVKEADPDIVNEIASRNNLSPVTALLLFNRGVTEPGKASAFLKPELAGFHDPLIMKDMLPAVEKLYRAIQNGTSIAIYGDYDVDGITATAILMEFITSFSSNVRYFIPERLRDGYGLKTENLEVLKRFGAELIITADCGVSNRAEINFGRDIGLDFIITDHHHTSEGVPEEVPVVNPQRSDCSYPNKNLAGAGVAFKLIQAIKTFAGEKSDPLADGIRSFDLDPLIEMVAIGSIGDVVPLVGENRVLTSVGLKSLRETKRPGIIALKKISGVTGNIKSSSVAFCLAPRLNSSGRLGRASRGVQLFLETSEQKARDIAMELDEENRYRQKLEKEILEESQVLVNERESESSGAIVLLEEHWHPGVIGIVASRLVDLYHRPAVLLAGTGAQIKGSIRSIPECPLPDILKECSEYLTSYGGHKLAAGFVIHRDNLENFRHRFDELSLKCAKEANAQPKISIDMEVDLKVLNKHLLKEISALEPFGCGNSHPVFLSRKVSVVKEPEVFGKNHLMFHVRSTPSSRIIKAIGFKMGHMAPYIWKQAPLDIVYTPEMEKYRGQQNLILNIKDFSTEYHIENGSDDQDQDSP